MSLERLIEPNISITELRPAEERTSGSLRALKNTPLYDRPRKQWNEMMTDGEPVAKGRKRFSHTQLLGVLAEWREDPDGARKKYETLQGTELYGGSWRHYMGEDQRAPTKKFNVVQDQLFGLLVESIVGDPDRAEKKYEALKENPIYYNKESKDEDGLAGVWKEPGRNFKYSTSQLLGIIIEGVLYKDRIIETKKKFEQLKKSLFYDEVRRLWNEANWPLRDFRNEYIFSTTDQLLGIIAEKVFDQNKGVTRLEEFKKSLFYDKEQQLWNFKVDTVLEEPIMHRYAKDQLLGIIAEGGLGDDTFSPEKKESMPEVRSF